ncbi:extracellular solute-binding protein [Paenibacillus koleovorans]|uniref:extracellular solute-binding protein n=1 Tax=Paenibacillus koleovorans TaxID=121608 RepID=UPI0013E409FB|nr:extracellular solute-binding protein [Paenibacillus koleovorans]
MKKNQNQYLYMQLADALREQILTHTITAGQFLPSENELSKQYGMSRISVRKALELLVQEGLVVRKMGQGTLVSHPAKESDMAKSRTLRIAGAAPSHFTNHCFPWLAQEFEKEVPDTKVALLTFPSHQFWESVQHSKLMGIVPEILLLSDRLFMDVEDYDDYEDLQQSVRITGNFFYPKLLSNFRQEQSLKAIPVTFSPVFMVYNPVLFERHGVPKPEPSWTVDDLLRAAKALTMDTNGDSIIDQYGLGISSSHTRWPVIALQHHVDFDKLDQNPDQLRSTLQLLHDLLHRDRTALLHTFNMNQRGQDPFLNEKVAMVYTTALEAAYWRQSGITFEPRAVPTRLGSKNSTLLVANSLMVPADCDEPELAQQFIEFIIRPDIQEQLLRRFGFLSVLKPINDQICDREFLEASNIADNQLTDSHFGQTTFPDNDKLEALGRTLALFWNGLDSVSQTIDKLKQPHSKV